MTIDAKPNGDDLRQFVCSGVNFDIDEKPNQKKRRSKSSGAEPRVGLGSLRARAEPKSKPIERPWHPSVSAESFHFCLFSYNYLKSVKVIYNLCQVDVDHFF